MTSLTALSQESNARVTVHPTGLCTVSQSVWSRSNAGGDKASSADVQSLAQTSQFRKAHICDDAALRIADEGHMVAHVLIQVFVLRPLHHLHTGQSLCSSKKALTCDSAPALTSHGRDVREGCNIGQPYKPCGHIPQHRKFLREVQGGIQLPSARLDDMHITYFRRDIELQQGRIYLEIRHEVWAQGQLDAGERGLHVPHPQKLLRKV